MLEGQGEWERREGSKLETVCKECRGESCCLGWTQRRGGGGGNQDEEGEKERGERLDGLGGSVPKMEQEEEGEGEEEEEECRVRA